MHVSFIPYGHRRWVEWFLRDMEAQKFPFIMKKGKKTKSVFLQGAIRILPFGVYEYVFPKESRDLALTSLGFVKDNNNHYLGSAKRALLRKMIKHKKIGKVDNSKKYPWITDHVSILVLGEKADGEFTEKDGVNKGWTHEGI